MTVKAIKDQRQKQKRDKDGAPVWEVSLHLRRRFHGSKVEAKRYEAKLRDAVNFRAQKKTISILAALPAWRAHHQDNNCTERHIDTCERVLKRLARELPAYVTVAGGAVENPNDIGLHEITELGLERWRHSRCKEAGARTVNRDVASLKALARWCIKTGRWEPLASVGVCLPDGALEQFIAWLMIPKLKHKPRAPIVPSPLEMCAALRAVPRHVRLPLCAFILLADRPAAITSLRWRDVHRPDRRKGSKQPGTIQLTNRKGGAARTLARPAGSLIWSCLTAAKRYYRKIKPRPPRRDDYVFVNSRGNPWSAQTLYGAFNHYLKRAGKKRGPIYSLRHGTGTLAASLGASELELQALLGHETRDMSRHYVDLADVATKSISARVEGVLSRDFKGLFAKPE